MTRSLILVTGASDGIGLETARQLVARGADVILHGRNSQRVQQAWSALSKAAGRELPAPALADFSSLANVAALARELHVSGVRPTVLVNNAGIFLRSLERSVDDIEMTMAVNHFAPFLLTQALLSQPGCALTRIVNVSSMAHARGSIDLTDIVLRKRPFDPYGMYAAAKLANVLHAVELARRLRGRVAVNALHPGVVSTKLLTEGFQMQGRDTLADAAATSVWLATEPDLAAVTGEYFAARRKAVMSPAAQDPGLAKDFFDKSQAVVAPFLS
jgi:NAD(P)-dependent dehydrogenase (short-subunit alcohol dehydrogenase family)